MFRSLLITGVTLLAVSGVKRLARFLEDRHTIREQARERLTRYVAWQPPHSRNGSTKSKSEKSWSQGNRGLLMGEASGVQAILKFWQATVPEDLISLFDAALVWRDSFDAEHGTDLLIEILKRGHLAPLGPINFERPPLQ
ncbi:hypothetical protein BSKO_04614 [Bryopsis sp. KO-2023]|nr:hypothetical protein BSKO_04614 [Bryopsis sp. KO-2023]